MCDGPPELDAAGLQAIARTRGLRLSPAEASVLARQSGPLLAEFRRFAATLCADDDMLAFRRILDDEAASG